MLEQLTLRLKEEILNAQIVGTKFQETVRSKFQETVRSFRLVLWMATTKVGFVHGFQIVSAADQCLQCYYRRFMHQGHSLGRRHFRLKKTR